MSDAIRVDREILGGVPCFAGTRVPVRSLFDHLKLGYSVDEFLEQFPTVKKEQVRAVLDEARHQLEDSAETAAR
jgi:uncharacterized protein (DUF433 family)